MLPLPCGDGTVTTSVLIRPSSGGMSLRTRDENLGQLNVVYKPGTNLEQRQASLANLRRKFEAIRRTELDRLDYKLASLPEQAREDARARVDEITHLIVEKLLLTPTEQLKAADDETTATAYTDALNRLFKLPGKETE